MTTPPLYKYLDVQGAKLTLGNQTFRHAKPSDFNDTEDLTIQSIFPDELEVALKKLSENFTDTILRHLNDPPTCSPGLRAKLALIQAVYRKNPEMADIVKSQIGKDPLKTPFDVEQMRAQSLAHIKDINEFMQGYRVLCVSKHLHAKRMWERYAQDHQGIALRIQPNVAQNSKFQLFKPVLYRKTRPPLYEDTLEFQEGALFGDQESRIKTAMERIIYTKTLDWEYEGEYRLAVPLREGEEWDTLSYHPDELTELYLGLSMADGVQKEIVALAKAVNPDIKVFKIVELADGGLSHVEVQ